MINKKRSVAMIYILRNLMHNASNHRVPILRLSHANILLFLKRGAKSFENVKKYLPKTLCIQLCNSSIKTSSHCFSLYSRTQEARRVRRCLNCGSAGTRSRSCASGQRCHAATEWAPGCPAGR